MVVYKKYIKYKQIKKIRKYKKLGLRQIEPVKAKVCEKLRIKASDDVTDILLLLGMFIFM